MVLAVSHENPSRLSAPGAKFSTRISEISSSLRKISLPCGDFRFSVTLRLLQFSMVKYKLSTSGRSRNCVRVISPRPGASILMTSAPSQAISCVQDGPDCTCVISNTRTPVNACPMAPLFSSNGLLVVMRHSTCLSSPSLTPTLSQGRGGSYVGTYAPSGRAGEIRLPVHRLIHRPRRIGLRVDPD